MLSIRNASFRLDDSDEDFTLTIPVEDASFLDRLFDLVPEIARRGKMEDGERGSYIIFETEDKTTIFGCVSESTKFIKIVRSPIFDALDGTNYDPIDQSYMWIGFLPIVRILISKLGVR